MKKLSDKNINTPEYWDKIYTKEILDDKKRIELERFEKVSNLINDGSTVIDIGCGPGEFVNFLYSKKSKCIISGIDFSKVAIDEAKKKCPKCSFYVRDVMNISKEYVDIDNIIAFEILEHLDNPVLFVNEMYKILKPGGILFLSTPYNDQVFGGDEHIYSFVFEDMIDFFEKTKIWEIIILMRHGEKLKNMFIVVKKI